MSCQEKDDIVQADWFSFGCDFFLLVVLVHTTHRPTKPTEEEEKMSYSRHVFVFGKYVVLFSEDEDGHHF